MGGSVGGWTGMIVHVRVGGWVWCGVGVCVEWMCGVGVFVYGVCGFVCGCVVCVWGGGNVCACVVWMFVVCGCVVIV